MVVNNNIFLKINTKLVESRVELMTLYQSKINFTTWPHEVEGCYGSLPPPYKSAPGRRKQQYQTPKIQINHKIIHLIFPYRTPTTLLNQNCRLNCKKKSSCWIKKWKVWFSIRKCTNSMGDHKSIWSAKSIINKKVLSLISMSIGLSKTKLCSFSWYPQYLN